MKQSERADIRCEFITGSFAIGPDGLKEPIGNKMFPGWPEYARKLEDEIHRLRSERIKVEVSGGVAFTNDQRVDIIDHDNIEAGDQP